MRRHAIGHKTTHNHRFQIDSSGRMACHALNDEAVTKDRERAAWSSHWENAMEELDVSIVFPLDTARRP
jgi:hypothetical protein